jgi:hypothetical protein
MKQEDKMVRVVLDIPFKQKDAARAAGAWWDPKDKLWVKVNPTVADIAKLRQWIPATPEREREIVEAAAAKVEQELREKSRIILDIPYRQRSEAKVLGARFDGTRKLWYAEANADTEKLKAFIPTAERRRELVKEAAAKVEAEQRERTRVILDVPYNDKDQAKGAGALWDGRKKLWYVDAGADLEKLNAWIPTAERRAELVKEAQAKLEAERADQRRRDSRILLDVPYDEKEQAKAIGARWNGEEKLWYAEGSVDLEKLARWIPTPERRQELLEEAAAKVDQAQREAERIVLDVPYDEKNRAKEAGARWDGTRKLWYSVRREEPREGSRCALGRHTQALVRRGGRRSLEGERLDPDRRAPAGAPR